MNSRPFLVIGIAIEVASIVVTLVSAVVVQQSYAARAEAVFERQVERGMQVVESRLRTYQQGLLGGVGLFNSHEFVSYDEWKWFVDSLRVEENYPGINGFGFIRRVHHAGVDGYVERLNQLFDHGFTLKTLGAAHADDRYIVELIEPLTNNLAAVGLDIGSDDIRRAAAQAAMDTGYAQITQIIHLVQDEQHKPGFLMLAPVYRGGLVPETVAQRRKHLTGWVFAPFIGEQVMAGVAEATGSGVRLSIYDGSVSSENTIYAGVTGDWGLHTIERNVQVGGLAWRFVWRSDGSNDSDIVVRGESWWVMFIGMVTSTGLLVVMLMLHRSNRRAIREAEQAVRVKGDFLSVMSHEIRTPLHGVIGMSELLEQRELDPETEEIVHTIRTSGESLLSLVNDILDLNRIEGGQVQLEEKAFEVSGVVNEACQLFADEAHRNQTEITTDIPDELWAIGDALRFRQITLNLLSNAIKFSPRAAVRVSVSRTDAAGDITLCIEDTGIGMDEAAVAKLYQPFSQGDASISRRFGGSGLGMTIVKHLIESMAGSIDCHSRIGAGTTFTICLPLPPVTESEHIRAHQVKVDHQLGLRVLVAEDNPVNQRVASAMLAKMGCQVVLANDGEEAVRACCDATEPFDVILMDCQMPLVDGLEATRRIRSAGQGVPIIAFTANAGDEFRERCMQAGMNDYLTKPLRQGQLAEAMQRWTSSGEHPAWRASEL